jgi:hypothetical protein
VRLERQGNAWLASNLPTAGQLEVYFEEDILHAYYKAATAELAFADDDGDGLPDRVLFAATASAEGEPSDVVDKHDWHVPLRAESEVSCTLFGKNADVFPSQGPLHSPEITASEMIDGDPRYWSGDRLAPGLLPILGLSQACGPREHVLLRKRAGRAI